jgi:hypothetical protein
MKLTIINRGNLRYWLIGSVCLHLAIYGVVRASSVANASSPVAIQAAKARAVAAQKAEEKRLAAHVQNAEKSVDRLVETLNTLEKVAEKEAVQDTKRLKTAAQNAPKRAIESLEKSLKTQKEMATRMTGDVLKPPAPMEEQHKEMNRARAIQEEAERAMSLLPESEQKKLAEEQLAEAKKQAEKFETEFDAKKAEAYLKQNIAAQEKALEALKEAEKQAEANKTERAEDAADSASGPKKKKKKHPGKPHEKKCFAPGGQ